MPHLHLHTTGLILSTSGHVAFSPSHRQPILSMSGHVASTSTSQCWDTFPHSSQFLRRLEHTSPSLSRDPLRRRTSVATHWCNFVRALRSPFSLQTLTSMSKPYHCPSGTLPRFPEFIHCRVSVLLLLNVAAVCLFFVPHFAPDADEYGDFYAYLGHLNPIFNRSLSR